MSLWTKLFGTPRLSDEPPHENEWDEMERRIKESKARIKAEARQKEIQRIATDILIHRNLRLTGRHERLDPRDGNDALDQAARIYELIHMRDNPLSPTE